MVHPAYLYALDKLGYWVDETTEHRFTDEELSAWLDAVDEWCSLHPDEPEP